MKMLPFPWIAYVMMDFGFYVPISCECRDMILLPSKQNLHMRKFAILPGSREKRGGAQLTISKCNNHRWHAIKTTQNKKLYMNHIKEKSAV